MSNQAATAEPSNADIVSILAEIRAAIDRRGAVAPHYTGLIGASAYSGISVESLRGLASAGKLTVYRPVRGRIVVEIAELDRLIRNSTGSVRNGRGQRSRQRFTQQTRGGGE